MVSASKELKTYFVEFETKRHRDKRRTLKKLFWFDGKYNVMYEIWGDQIRMRWSPEWNRSVPDVEWDKTEKRWTVKDVVYELKLEYRSNKDEIQSWLDNIASRLGAEINNEETDSRGIAINIQEHLSTEIEYLLDRKGFRYSEI